jgi:hypothetical protein
MAYPVTEPRILDQGRTLGSDGPPNNRCVQNAVGVGVAASQVFTTQPGPGDQANVNVLLNMIPVGGTVTTFTADHEVSSDNGVSWQKKGATIDFVATPAVQVQTAPGILNRLNVKTFVLGTGTSAIVDATA